MIFAAWDVVSIATNLGLGIVSLAIGICFVRLWIGPSLPDRVVALDTVATVLVGMLVLIGIADEAVESLRVASVLALVNFVGTIGFAFYLRRSQIR